MINGKIIPPLLEEQNEKNIAGFRFDCMCDDVMDWLQLLYELRRNLE
jgi:hypothetical protein